MANKYSGVSQLSNGAWQYRIKTVLPNGEKIDTTSKKDENGNLYLTAKQCYEAKMNHIARLQETPDTTPNRRKKTTLTDIYNNYLKTSAKTKATATLRKQASMWKNHFKPDLGNREIATITLAELQDYIDTLYIEKGYSYKYVEGFLKFFYLLFGHAYRMDKIDARIYTRMFIDKGTRLTMPKMTQEDGIEDEAPAETYGDSLLRDLYDIFSGKWESYEDETPTTRRPHNKGDSNLLTAFCLGLYAGLRISEVFALRWRDIDWNECTITVRAQLQYDGVFYLAPVKTLASVRKVLISQPLHDQLLRAYNEQQEQQKILGTGYRNTERVEDRTTRKIEVIQGGDFINRKKNGELLTTNSIKYYAKKIRDEIGLNFKFHNLRHTFASTCAINNMNLQMLMQQMGHKKIETTRKYYININNDELKRKTQLLMDSMYSFQGKEFITESGEKAFIIKVQPDYSMRKLKHIPR